MTHPNILPLDPIQRLDLVLDEAWRIFKSQFINQRHYIYTEAPFQHHFADIINRVGNLYCINRKDHFLTDLETKFPNLKEKTKYLDITCGFHEQSSCAIELKYKKESQGAQDHGRIDIYQDLEAVEIACSETYDIGRVYVITDSKPYINQSKIGVGTIFPTHNGHTIIADKEIISTSKGREGVSVKFKCSYKFEWEQIENFYFLSISFSKNDIKNSIKNQDIKISENTFYEWNGYCPESFLKGEEVRMRHNANDFYESEKTGLQVALMFPGVQAVVMNFRGNGKFRETEKYADEVYNYEILTKQTLSNPPFGDKDLLQNTKELQDYLQTIM